MQAYADETYTFDELSESAKEAAREWWRQTYPDYEWWDYVFDMAKAAGECLGIDVDRIYFSGFGGQGDGACFEGTYSYNKGWRKALKKEFGGEQLAELEKIGSALQAVQSSAFYKLSANVRQSGHYMHSGCTYINVDHEDRHATDDEDEGIQEALRDFMDWIYRRLEAEFDWIMSDEQVDEAILANGYEFTEDGAFVR